MAYFRCTTGGSGKGNTLVVTCADDLAGATITCTNGTKTYTKTCPSTAPYEVTFYGLEAGTWTVSATVSGSTYTTTVVITDYEAELGGFNWKTWVNLSENYTSSDFTDLDDLLSDETAIRELMTIHACVDYLAGIAATSADVEKIIENDYCAKWINNRDYALDTLYANEIIAGYMDTADKYFYGEWVITDNTTTPPTWGAKGNVPIMTGASAPYGTVVGSGNLSGYDPYKAFDGNDSSDFRSDVNSTILNKYVGYIGTNPSCVKKVKARIFGVSGGTVSMEFALQGTNDGGTTWENIKTGITASVTASQDTVVEETISTNDKYYLGHRLIGTNSAEYRLSIKTIQFYGRELSVSVPKMDTNTTPYGEASTTGSRWGSGSRSYMAFDGNVSTCAEESIDGFKEVDVIYDFKKDVVVHKIYMNMANAGGYDGNHYYANCEIVVQGYDGNDWVDIIDTQSVTLDSDGWPHVELTLDATKNIGAYQKYRWYGAQVSGQTYRPVPYIIQYWGFDYSEKEFEVGATKKWLYDHGVELETITISGTGTKGTDAIQLTAANAQAVATIDTTAYTLMRGKAGAHASGTNQLICGSGSSNFTANNMPYNNGFDVSSVNGSNAVGVKQTANGIFDATEFWLE